MSQSHFLQYSNENHVNIIPQNEFENLVKEVFGVIASNITKSLGPLGSSATILDGSMTEATKDGYSILKKYRFHNRYKRMIYNLIQAPCTKMNNTVGDGTTTAIALTNAIFNAYESNKATLNTMYRLPRQLINAWDDVIAHLIARVQVYATPIDPEDYDTIYHLAYVTSNGNHEISDAVASVYKKVKMPSIKQKDSPTNKSYIQEVNGFEFPANLIADAFITDEDGSTTKKDICVMVFDHKINETIFTNCIIKINEVLRAMNTKLLILAPSYDGHMADTVMNQYVNREFNMYGGNLNLIIAQYNMGKLQKNQLHDLAVILRTKVITEDLAKDMCELLSNNSSDLVVEKINEDNTYPLYRLIGNAAEAILSTTRGSIFHVNDIESDKTYVDTYAAAKRELEELINSTPADRQSYSAKIYDAQARIIQLEMRNFIYYIGADSALQKQITWDSVEDVIKCLTSAIRYGVVPGCQLSIIRACDEYIQYMVTQDNSTLHIALAKLIKQGVINVYLQVLHGASGDGMVKLVPNWFLATPENKAEIENQAIEIGRNTVAKSIELQQVFDLDSCTFTDSIITSAQTDTMVLTCASELVKILISGNQCIFLDSEVNDMHQDTPDAYI